MSGQIGQAAQPGAADAWHRVPSSAWFQVAARDDPSGVADPPGPGDAAQRSLSAPRRSASTGDHLLPEGERRDRRRGVGADARQLEGGTLRSRPAVTRDDDAGLRAVAAPAGCNPAPPSRPAPRRPWRRPRRRRAASATRHRLVARDDPGDLRLLQHHLADEDRVRIVGRAATAGPGAVRSYHSRTASCTSFTGEEPSGFGRRFARAVSSSRRSSRSSSRSRAAYSKRSSSAAASISSSSSTIVFSSSLERTSRRP